MQKGWEHEVPPLVATRLKDLVVDVTIVSSQFQLPVLSPFTGYNAVQPGKIGPLRRDRAERHVLLSVSRKARNLASEISSHPLHC